MRQAGRRLARLGAGRRHVFVVSAPRVWRRWGGELTRGLRAGGMRADAILVNDREQNKRLAVVERLAEKLLRRGADRGALLAAFGGMTAPPESRIKSVAWRPFRGRSTILRWSTTCEIDVS